MENNTPTPNSLLEKNKKIQEDLEVAMNTEGFPILTKKQQQMIKMSLYVQSRAERIIKKKLLGGILSWHTIANKSSKNYVDDKNCHSSLLSIEKENSKEFTKNTLFDVDFFNAEFNYVETTGVLKKQIEEFGFPCVLHIRISFNPAHTEIFHSCIVLGHDKQNNIVVWEKEGNDYPYRITTLDQVFNDYGIKYQYGLRKLRTQA